MSNALTVVETDVIPGSFSVEHAIDSLPTPEQALARMDRLNQIINTVMIEGVHYGKIPGMEKAKPTLYAAGVDMLAQLFSLVIETEMEYREVDYTGADHNGTPYWSFEILAKAYSPDGRLIATGRGSQNSEEERYKYRKHMGKCPSCGVHALCSGTDRQGHPNFYCYKREGGCGANFGVDEEGAREGYYGTMPDNPNIPRGKRINPEMMALMNTGIKMAEIRARRQCLYNTIGLLRGFFAQDVESINDVRQKMQARGKNDFLKEARTAGIEKEQVIDWLREEYGSDVDMYDWFDLNERRQLLEELKGWIDAQDS